MLNIAVRLGLWKHFAVEASRCLVLCVCVYVWRWPGFVVFKDDAKVGDV